MESELRRIRERDFSDIDNKLYQNLERTDNLTSALSHLSDFQRFLMEQIDTLETSKKTGQQRNPLAKSIAKNFDNLRTSLVRCSQAKPSPANKQPAQLRSLRLLMGSFSSIKRDIQDLKNTTVRETEKSLKCIKNAYEKDVKQVWKLVLEQKCKNMEAASIIQNLEQQKEQLEQEKNRITMQRQQLSRENEELRQVSSSMQQTLETPRLSINTEIEQFKTPLKDSSTLNNITQQQCWKINRDSSMKSSHPATPVHAGQEIFLRPSDLTAKQNSILASKGVRPMSRGKSRQKIKVFSMF